MDALAHSGSLARSGDGNRQRCNFALRHRTNISLTHSLRGGHAMAGCAA
jgi:hypothetical protein